MSEEAAVIATEYISSLDNLPSEVQFLLMEIREKETRCQEIQTRVAQKTAQYLRHSRGGTLSGKDESIPAKVDADYERLDKLCNEKIALARRIQELIAKACGRLDADLERLHAFSEPLPPEPSTLVYSGSSRIPLNPVVESFRGVIPSSPDPIASPPVGQTGSPMPPNKKKRLNTNVTTIALTSTPPAPPPVVPHASSSRSRLSTQIHPIKTSPPPSRRAPSSTGAEDDAEGEEDADDVGEEGGDTEDQSIYCTCRKLSYGQMIGCDNDECPFQWFHLGCVGMKEPLPEHWYCPQCAPKFGKAAVGNDTRGATAASVTRKRKR